MKVTGIFFQGIRSGTYCGGKAYLGGTGVELNSNYTIENINVRGLKVYERQDKKTAKLHGTVMELVDRKGSLAIVKDSYDNEKVAVLHDTYTPASKYALFVLGALIAPRKSNKPRKGYKSRWILMN